MANISGDEPLAVPASSPVVSQASAAVDEVITSEKSPEPPKVGSGYIWLQVLANFGVFVAFITPIAISLAIRISALAPGNEEQYLAYTLGSGAAVVMLTAPLFGVLSDRTRTRWGRRRPFMFVAMFVGILSLFVMALAPSVLVLGAGWILAQIGWGQVYQNLHTSMADKLPESQRGKVSGLTGFATQIAPVFGVVIAGSFAADPLMLFLLPGVFGVVTVLLFVFLTKEADSRTLDFGDRLSISTVFRKYLYNPRQFPDFSWVWLSRFMFYFGLTLNTTFSALFFASRLGVKVADVAPVIATLSLFGILATTLGAIGGGFLSDKLRSRRAFVLVGSVVFAIGAVTMAFGSDIPMLYAGSLITGVGIGIFAAVDHALMLDVLPEKDTDAGRFMGIIGFAVSIPQAVAPFIAPLILGIGISATGDKNYTLLYIIAGVFTALAGLIVLRVRAVR